MGVAPVLTDSEQRRLDAELMQARFNPVVAVDDVVDGLSRHLRALEASGHRGGLQVIRVSLTAPNNELNDWPARAVHFPRGEPLTTLLMGMWLWEAADLFAHVVAKRDAPHGAAYVALDVSDAGRAHHYGVVLTSMSPFEVYQCWRQLVPARPDGEPLEKKAQRVCGQKRPWTVANHVLWTNLYRVVDYSMKPLPSGFDRPVGQRILAAGSWAGQFDSLPMVGEGQPRGTANKPRESSHAPRRPCIRCGEPIPKGKRSHTMYHSASCRTMAWRDRRRRCGLSAAPPVTVAPVRRPDPGLFAVQLLRGAPLSLDEFASRVGEQSQRILGELVEDGLAELRWSRAGPLLTLAGLTASYCGEGAGAEFQVGAW
jgi:hypothetical protein